MTLLPWMHDLLDQLAWEVEQRSWVEWVFGAFVVIVFVEVPRYYLTLVGTTIAHFLGLPRLDRRKVEALWARKPLVSVVVAGRNEASGIEACIQSLLDQDWPNYEIIVVDDNSTDDMTRLARRYLRDPKVRFARNDGICGRGGRPSASNLGLRLARGEFLVSVDADCKFNRNLIRAAIAPFSDPKVGVVAGNIHIKEPHGSWLRQFQALEYAVSIDMRKRWTTLWNCTLQASGALGAFRTAVLRELNGWDPELAEDTDLSLRVRKQGYTVCFQPEAVVYTEPPDTWRGLIRQRTRWDRGGFRNFFAKHYRLMNPRQAGWSFAFEMWEEFFLTVVATAAYPIYMVYMLFTAPMTLLVLFGLATLATCWLSLLSLALVATVTNKVDRPWKMMGAAFLTPFYKEVCRWARVRALFLEIARWGYEDPFLPRTVWREAPRR